MTENFNRKKTLLIICTTEFFSCFSFFGTLSLLILFLIRHAGIPEKISYSIFGNFASLSCVSALIGGFIGGRYLTFRFSSILGLTAYALGYFILAIDQKIIFIDAGLTLVACGAGLFEPNIRTLLGIHYNQCGSEERNSGFILLHIFNICGQIFGPITLTFLNRVYPSLMFITSGIACVLGGIIFLNNYQNIFKLLENEHIKKPIDTCKGLSIVILLLALIFFILYQRDVKYILEAIFTGVFVILIIALPRMEYLTRVKIITICLILTGLVAAEICFRQAFGTINLFTSTHVNRTLFHVMIPTGVFQSLEPSFVLILFIWVLKLRKKLEKNGHGLSSGGSISLGLLSLSIAFCFLIYGIFLTTQKMALIWLVLFYAVMAFAELFTIPIATATTAALSPKNLRGPMMGIFFLSAGLSSYLSGHIGEYISPHAGNPSLSVYKNLFLTLAAFSAISCVCLYFVWKYWKKKNDLILSEETKN
ncbi:MAG: hypothetical protein COY58_00475 [Gammaproteobacteria bacterium CG_4_10_14_0_8_um_filter_38_16]|nr:MAG: hypothetical protein COY58_00475 [Gammaproteobacteria bacterium CG_4_10_14_0_8_um_filter_38_16]PJA04233.1 MAG: hypothetical protein COX72_01275 [Gammaproteobacteria bacterium CG_4_10_14_0_2_um_filter_38_22]PJB10939.1 MAG: hypothetical protein CO120_02350 [Gammaproteobacteria bacterium CG_4_9_14_3_um_filter_38_9]